MSSAHRSALLRAAAGAFVLSLGLAPTPAPAQAANTAPAWRIVTRAESDRARADSLVALAERPQLAPSQGGAYLEVARLYRRAAQLRGDDTAAVGNWRLAAWAYSASGDNGLALAMMKQAGESAARVGDVERSIQSFIDAALIAIAAGRTDQVAPLIGRTRALLDAPLLPAARRAEFRRRIGDDPALAAAMRE